MIRLVLRLVYAILFTAVCVIVIRLLGVLVSKIAGLEDGGDLARVVSAVFEALASAVGSIGGMILINDAFEE